MLCRILNHFTSQITKPASRKGRSTGKSLKKPVLNPRTLRCFPGLTSSAASLARGLRPTNSKCSLPNSLEFHVCFISKTNINRLLIKISDQNSKLWRMHMSIQSIPNLEVHHNYLRSCKRQKVLKLCIKEIYHRTPLECILSNLTSAKIEITTSKAATSYISTTQPTSPLQLSAPVNNYQNKIRNTHMCLPNTLVVNMLLPDTMT